jgi:CDP-glycerol glycerophosphotransferase (TagB/SpsB family)
MPRDNRLWAFGSGDGRFDGNTKYLFLWMSKHRSPITPVWITSSRALAQQLQARGLNGLYRWSIEGMRAAARAGLFFVNDNSGDINFGFSGGARVFNLWHGVGLKNVLFGATVGYGAKLLANSRNPIGRLRNMRRFERPEWVLSTSREMAEKFFKRCFDVPLSRAPALGYPRLDPALDEPLKELGRSFDDYTVFDCKNGATKSIIYVPTYRDHEPDLFGSALPDLAMLSSALEAQNAQLLLKIHPKMKLNGRGLEELPHNIRVVPTHLDIYPMLHSVDALITDYSSLFFDYIYAKSEGIVLYTYDHDQYIARERDLAWDYDEATVGVRASSFSSLCDVIRDGRVFQPLDQTKLSLLRNRFWGGPATLPTASDRIVTFLLAQDLDSPDRS